MTQLIKIGVITVSDRASRGEYEDKGGPAVNAWLSQAIKSDWQAVSRVIPDEQSLIENTIIELCDVEKCCMVVTTGGTGPAKRDITPEATLAVCDKEMQGFGELMRTESLKIVPTAILSRQTAGIRGESLVVNLPGKPSAISDCMNAIFPAVPCCISLIGGPSLDTNDNFIKVFWPGRK